MAHKLFFGVPHKILVDLILILSYQLVLIVLVVIFWQSTGRGQVLHALKFLQHTGWKSLIQIDVE